MGVELLVVGVFVSGLESTSGKHTPFHTSAQIGSLDS